MPGFLNRGLERRTGARPGFGNRVGGGEGVGFGGNALPNLGGGGNTGGPARPSLSPPGFGSPGPSPGGGVSVDPSAFFDRLLLDRSRHINAQGRAAFQTGLGALEQRGLGTSSGVSNLFNSVNQGVASQTASAASDVFGQRFARQEQLGAEQRSRDFQEKMSKMSFEQQAALIRLASELEKGGGSTLEKLVGAAGSILGGLL